MSLPELVLIGPLLIDEIIQKDETSGQIQLGGSALYGSLAAAACGVKVGLVSIIGNDYPIEFLNTLSEKNISLLGVEKLDKPSCRCRLYYTNTGRHYTYPEGYPDFSEVCPSPNNIPAEWFKAKHFHISPFIYSRQAEVFGELRKDKNKIISIDPVDIIPEEKTQDYLEKIRNVDFFMPSEMEFKLFYLDSNDLYDSLRDLSNKLNACVTLKRSHRGSISIKPFNNNFIEIPIIENINPFDISGAGDTFCGAFHASWLQTKDLKYSLQMATVVASFVIEDSGINRLLTLTQEEIQLRYQKAYW